MKLAGCGRGRSPLLRRCSLERPYALRAAGLRQSMLMLAAAAHSSSSGSETSRATLSTLDFARNASPPTTRNTTVTAPSPYHPAGQGAVAGRGPGRGADEHRQQDQLDRVGLVDRVEQRPVPSALPCCPTCT